MSQYGALGFALHGFDYEQILAHYYQGTSLGTVDPRQAVRVLLATGPASFTGADTVAGAPGVHLEPSVTYDVTRSSGSTLALSTSAGRPVANLKAPLVVSGPGPLTVPGLGSYLGSLQLTPDGAGVATVNVVGLDDYVRGVVAAEMPSSWPAAALEAQAVAARTYAITTSVGAGYWDLYSDTRSQVYGGVGAQTPATDAAVAATAGQVVTYNGRPAVTYFFASSGGYTQSVQDAWPGAAPEPWLVAVPDPYDAAGANPYHRWTVRLTQARADALLAGVLDGRLVGILAAHDGRSPYVVSATIVGSAGATKVSGAQLQSMLALRSTNASFTTIATADPAGGSLTGSIFPAPRAGTVVEVQRLERGWRTVARIRLSAAGGLRVAVGAGRYRVAYGPLSGPAVTVR